MNRRRAISRILFGGASIAIGLGGYKCYRISMSPDINFLIESSKLISSLSEVIIPSTDTPGALEAEVHLFIISTIKKCTDKKTQNNFINGLKDIQLYCVSTYGQLFQSCSMDQKESSLKFFEEKGKPISGILGKLQTRFLGKPFFLTLKEYTVEGFCTSKLGATKGLFYDYVPGNYIGCVPLKPGQRAWATN